jgi:hypothetical protein
LIEAVAHGTVPDLVQQSARFVESLRGEHVTLEHAQQMAKVYRPPKIGGRARQITRKNTKLVPGHARTWVVQLARTQWDVQDYAAQKKGMPIAKHRLTSTRRFEVDDFSWTGAEFARRVKCGDLAVQVLEEKSRRIMVYPPARVLHIRNYTTMKGNRSSIVFLETPKALRRKTLAQVREALGRAGALLHPKSGLTLLRDAQLNHRLHQLWPAIS